MLDKSFAGYCKDHTKLSYRDTGTIQDFATVCDADIDRSFHQPKIYGVELLVEAGMFASK